MPFRLRPVKVWEAGARLGEAEVAKFDEALAVDEDVLGLEVAIDNGVVVQVLQRQHDAGDIESRQALVHPLQHLHLNAHSRCKLMHRNNSQELEHTGLD